MNLQNLIVRPSGLALTVACHASLQLQASIPALPPTEEQLEGDAAHWVAMRYAAGYGHELPVGTKFLSKGRTWEVDQDMVTGALMYATACGTYHPTLMLEEGVTIPRVHPTQCKGTPDAWRFYPDAREAFRGQMLPTFGAETGRLADMGMIKFLRILDYKYGHRFVEVFECYQLSGYAAGVMDRLQLDDNDPNLFLELTLVQPRCYHKEGPVRTWSGPAHMLRATLNIARQAAHAALAENPMATTNDGCIDCTARHACTTLQRATNAYVEFSTSAEIVELPPEALGQELALVEDALERLKARATGLSAQAEALLRQGKRVAFYGMEEGQSLLRYKDDVNISELTGLAELLNIDLKKPETLKNSVVTPTQAIAMGVDPEVMKHYSHRPRAALRLARDNSLTARKVFSK